MPPKIDRSEPGAEAFVDRITFVSKEDSAKDGTSRWMPLSLLFLVGIGFFLIGFLLVFLGSVGTVSSGGCFFWPFPVIVACGLGTGGRSLLLIGLLATFLTSLILLLGWRTRKPRAEGSPAETTDKALVSHLEESGFDRRRV